MEHEQIPQELKCRDQWVCWRDERGTKIPKIAGSSRNAKSSDPETWRSFVECVAAVEKRPSLYAGIGYVLAKDDPFVGIDLDDVRDPETGALAERAAEIIRRFDSYAEVSPSRKGVKVFVRGLLNRAKKKPGVEVYPCGRFFTVTGWILPQAPSTIEERQAELDTLLGEEFPEPEHKPRKPYDGPPEARIDLVEFLEIPGVTILGEVADDTAEHVYSVLCPWWREHTGGDRSGTRVGQYADGALWFRCEHAHCARRGWGELREFVCPSRSLRRGKVYARREREVRRG